MSDDPVQYLIHPALRSKLDAWLATQNMRVDRMPESEQREDQLDLYLVAPADMDIPAHDLGVGSVEGIEYTPEGVESVRELLIELRNTALTGGLFTTAVGLSHAIVYLSHYRDALGSTDPFER